MDKLDKLKLVSGAVVSLGVGFVVGNVIKATTPDDLRLITKVTGYVGAAALTGVLGTMASNYTKDQLDSFVNDISVAKAAYDAVANPLNTD